MLTYFQNVHTAIYHVINNELAIDITRHKNTLIVIWYVGTSLIKFRQRRRIMITVSAVNSHEHWPNIYHICDIELFLFFLKPGHLPEYDWKKIAICKKY